MVRYVVVGFCTAVPPTLVLLEAEAISWVALAGGFVASAMFVGPTQRTRIGRRIDDWWRRIGKAGRITVIVGFAAILWGWLPLFDPSMVPVGSFGLGFALTIVGAGLARLTRRLMGH